MRINFISLDRSFETGKEIGSIESIIVPHKKSVIYFKGTSLNVIGVNINYDTDIITVFVKKVVIDPVTKALWNFNIPESS